jgi:excisionase family DNA binding protein
MGGVVVANFVFYGAFSDSVVQSAPLFATDRGLDSPGASVAANKTLDYLIVSCHIGCGEHMKRPASISAAVFLTGVSCADVAALTPAIAATLIDINELSRRLSVAKGTLYNWVYLRRIPFVKVGRCVRFDYQEVLETLRQCPIIDTSASGRRII